MTIARGLRGGVTAALVLIVVSTAPAQYGGGSGTAQDPYQIATAADLIALGETPADYDKRFVGVTGADVLVAAILEAVGSP